MFLKNIQTVTNKIKDANLLKKYHQNLVYDYTEYPTKGNWNLNFKDEDYKKALETWLPANPESPILFYIHTPFCEQLCYFCLCSKEITQDYEKVKEYLYNYLYKELDILFNFLEKKKIKLNVREIYFGGGSPTYYKNLEFENLTKKLKSYFNFNNIGDWTVEIDPRRVDEQKLLFYRTCGVNRISFGVQDFDVSVQERINRIQPPELLHNLLTPKVRQEYPAFNFDLLVGLPGQTPEGMEKTMDIVINLRPTQLQTMMMHYKPNTRKYMIKMLKDGPLPDFYDRKILYAIAEKKLLEAGYTKTGYESYALPGDPIEKNYKNKKTFYGPLGAQKGDVTNFISVGSSAHGNLADDYYFQNYYEQNLYREALDANKLPIYRGIKLSEDDKIRRYIVKNLRTYFEINYLDVNKKFAINFSELFKKNLEQLGSFADDGLIKISDHSLSITELGIQFSPQIANIFDAYNPAELNY